MATNHTENLGLNLWEPQDSFAREEFNENTEKLAAELDRLRENVFDLAYYVGAENLWDGQNDTYSRRLFPVFSISFSGNPSRFTCTGGVVMESDRVTLSGINSTGSISFSKELFISPKRKGKSVRLWIHYNGGSIKPFLNGVEMKREAFYWDSSPVGGSMECIEYSLEAPYTSKFTLKLEMDCGPYALMTLYDLVMAQL